MNEMDSSIDILYIEDDAIDILNAQREFKKVNSLINISIASDGVDALNKLYGRNGEVKLEPAPKVILLDLKMPKMNGVEFLEILRADHAFNFTKVYILTASYNTKAKLAMSDLRVAGCIVKPLQYEDAVSVFWALFTPGVASN